MKPGQGTGNCRPKPTTPILFGALLVLTISLLSSSAETNDPRLFQGEFKLRKDLAGAHPRLFFTEGDMAKAAAEYAKDPKPFASVVPTVNSKEMTQIFPPMTQGETGVGTSESMAKVILAHALTKNPKYLERMREWIPMLTNYEPLVFTKTDSKGNVRMSGNNVELCTGGVLLNLAVAYDAIKGRSDPKFEEALRHALTVQARTAYRNMTAFKQYAFDQNHYTIPMAGLAIAAMALLDEEPEAKSWAVFASNFVRRGLSVLSPDAWFFEGPSYWNFTMHYLVTAAAALKQTTGEDLFAQPPLNAVPTYLAHMVLPNPEFVFDFCDWGPRVQRDGVSAQKGWDAPWHTLKTHLEMMTPSEIQWFHPTPLMENFLNRVGPTVPNANKGNLLYMRQLIRFPTASQPMKNGPTNPPYHYFPDMDVLHWRSSWEQPDATALAFKAGPPAGHRVTTLLPLYSNWKPGLGHAHPDAGTFTLFAKGVFLANGDNGYGRKDSFNCNTILVDGQGQGTGGTFFGCFAQRPYSDFDKVHMENVWLDSSVAAGTAVFDSTYDPTLQVKTMRRDLILIEGRYLVVRDRVASDLPHQYRWLLHGDQKATNPEPNRFLMENGQARLAVQNLRPVGSSKIEPTILDTELYDAARTRPRQHGFHIALESPAGKKEFQFLTAMLIQSATEPAGAFTAKLESDGRITLSDGTTHCTVWLEGHPGLKGSFAYLICDRNGTKQSQGLSGQSIDTEAFTLHLKPLGQVVMHLKN
ncbi:MAG: DUF4962 domain-containing protein [Verrucomicrobiota bacterium]